MNNQRQNLGIRERLGFRQPAKATPQTQQLPTTLEEELGFHQDLNHLTAPPLFHLNVSWLQAAPQETDVYLHQVLPGIPKRPSPLGERERTGWICLQVIKLDHSPGPVKRSWGRT